MLIIQGMKTHTDIRRCFRLIVLLFITVPHGETAEGEVKRQGIFGPCQGWGAGCGTNYITSRDSPRREQSLRAPTVSDSVEEPSYIPDNSFLFTSGGSWKPIGKRVNLWAVTSGNSWGPLKRQSPSLPAFNNDFSGFKRSAWFTDIPYLRNPLISFPKFNQPQGMEDFYRRYPLTYKNLLRKSGGRRLIQA